LSNYPNLRKDEYPEGMISLGHKITKYFITRSEISLEEIK
jgi:hypothetical protein